MVGKITTVLAKKEAEAYCSQGLHQEAVNLFSGLLASTGKMNPAIQNAIQSQLQDIRQQMRASSTRRQRNLCPEEIRRIRDGWGDGATETDILVCAQAFYQLGAYDEALRELKKLLKSRHAKRVHITAAADCLGQLHPPEQLPAAAEALAREIRSDNKSVWAALMVMAKHLEAGRHKPQALAIYLHLALIPELAAALQPRIDALSRHTPEPIPAAPLAPTPPPAHERPPAPPIANRRFSLKRLSAFFKKRTV